MKDRFLKLNPGKCNAGSVESTLNLLPFLIPVRNPFKAGWYIGLICVVFFWLFSQSLIAQTIVNPVIWYGTDDAAGYSVQKIVSNTSIESGVDFSYTITYTAPAGVTEVKIRDLMFSPDITGVTVAPMSAVCTSTPNVTTVQVAGGYQVDYTLSQIPTTCAPSGSFTIVVKFKEGTTCNGSEVKNKVGILVDKDYRWTDDITTTAIAVDPWRVAKWILSGAVADPNGGSCGNLIPADGTVKYQIVVYKENPYHTNGTGQQNITGATVVDVLPANAQLISSTCTPAGGNFTWNIGTLDATIPFITYSCNIEVKYPAAYFPNGSVILNEAVLTGTSCQQQVVHTSNQTCVKVGQACPNPNATLQKFLALDNRVPGCNGFYDIQVRNTGNVNFSPFNVDDAIPPEITVRFLDVYDPNLSTTVTVNSNLGTLGTPNMTSNQYNIQIPSGTLDWLSMQMTGILPPNNGLTMRVYFTVDPNLTGTVVTNCATLDPLANTITPTQTCTSFTVEEGSPYPCLYKSICDPQQFYSPGETVRFRLRIQNIGGADISGAAISDLLHSNFTYVGNESYFTANFGNPQCSTGNSIPPNTTAWSGVTQNNNPYNQNLIWNLPAIPSECQLFYFSQCGFYGTLNLPFYFIEFDAVVSDFAAPGVVNNTCSISGGTLSATYNSNTVHTLVVASFGQEVEKLVSTDNGVTYAPSGVVNPGGTARYQLKYKNMSNVPVTSITLADLLGKDDVGTNDWLILNRTLQRGSQFDISEIPNSHQTSSSSGPQPSTTQIIYANGSNICLPDFGLVLGCNAPGPWNSVPERNMKMIYPSFDLMPASTLTEHFNVSIPANAQAQQKVCNDFAAISTATFLNNSSALVEVPLTPIAAPPICLTVNPDNIHGDGPCPTITGKRYNNWYFGRNIGMSFNSGSPTNINNSAMYADEGCASISDLTTGNILFYTNGREVYNSSNQTINSGNLLFGGAYSSKQSALIIPRPNSATNYYIFTTPEPYGTLYYGIYYSEVNTSGGNATMVSSNNLLYDLSPCSEKITAVCDPLGGNIWVIAHTQGNDIFLFIEINIGTGVVSFHHTQTIGDSYSPDMYGGVGEMKASPDGKMLAVTTPFNGNLVELYDIDYTNGTPSLINYRSYQCPFPYTLDFSPDSKFFYVGNIESHTPHLQQFEVASFPPPANSATVICTQVPITGFDGIWGLQLAPDGKIYCCGRWQNQLYVIDNPNVAGAGCNFQQSISFPGITTPGTINQGTGLSVNSLPNIAYLCCVPQPQLGSICGMKFNDKNGNGALDAGEPGLPNWTISLSGSIATSTLTDASGNYCFNDLPAGTYTVTETCQNDWQQTCPVSGTYTAALGEGLVINNLDFGNHRECVTPPPDMVAWWPLDEQTGATLINDIAPPPASVFNNAGVPMPGGMVGSYSIPGKVAGAMVFANNFMEVPSQSELNFGTGDFSIDAWIKVFRCDLDHLSSIVDKFDNNSNTGFSFYLNQNPSGTGFLNLNINGSTFTSSGSFAANANPVLNIGAWYHVAVIVKHYTPGNLVSVQFYINGVAAGNSITTSPGNITNTLPLWIGQTRVAGARCELMIDEIELFNRALDASEVLDIWSADSSGKCKYSSICGIKFNDQNGNGVQDQGEPGLHNWTISLSGSIATSTLTDANGNYCFPDLAPGTYTVSEVPQNCWHQTRPASPGTYIVTLTSGQTINNQDFGNQMDVCIPPPPGMIAWWPLDGSGTPISDNLKDIVGNHNGIAACYPMNDDIGKVGGACRFNLFNGAALRVFNDPFTEIGDGDFTIDAWIFPENITVNQEYHQYTENRIILDNRLQNNFRIQAWPGITFYVKNEQWNATDSQWESMRLGLALKDNTSDFSIPTADFLSTTSPIVPDQWQHVAVVISRSGNGTFYYNGTPIGTFTPVPGTFVDVLHHPSMMDIGHASSGNCVVGITSSDYFNGLLDEIEIFNQALDPSEISSIYAAGSAGKCKLPGAICGMKFNDLNEDGNKQSIEPGLYGWTINLTGTATLTTTTDVNGNYCFNNLPDGTYSVTETQQNGWQQTYPSAAQNGTHTVTITAGQTVDHINFGNYRISDCDGNFRDSRDGTWYGYKNIGTQTWMCQNLAYLPAVWTSSVISETNPYYYVYDYQGTVVNNAKNTPNYSTYGVLYNWPAVMAGAAGSNSIPSGVQGICPAGWHLPSNAEWLTLLNYLGGAGVAGGKLKETGTTHWLSPNADATNSSGFTGLPGGRCDRDGYFEYLGHYANFWTASQYDQSGAWSRYLSHDNFQWVDAEARYKGYGLSVRCLMDDNHTGEIHGMKFNDLNGNGVLDTGEPGLPGWTIILSGPTSLSTLTDATGNYSIINLPAGTYTITETSQSGWQQTFPASPGSYTVTLAAGQNLPDINFGNIYTPCCDQTFTDNRDSHIYHYTTIGTQIWMCENLAYLPAVSPPTIGSGTDPYYYVHGYMGTNILAAKSSPNYTTYGVLYNWPAAMDGDAPSNSVPSGVRGICPAGWHLPSDAEWTILTTYLGGINVAGAKMKETGNSHWTSPNAAATNSSCFTALPAGFRDRNGGFYSLTSETFFWSASVNSSSAAWYRSLYDYWDGVYQDWDPYLSPGMSIRCLKDDNTGQLRGKKFDDLNGNGIPDSGETGISGWTITLSGTTSSTTITDNSGNYSFQNLPPGSYILSEVPQNCWHQTTPASPGTYSVTLTAGQTINNLDFGNQRDVCVTPPSDMLAWWPLDGQGTTISDNLKDIAGNHNATIPCNPPTDISGKVAGACRFDVINKAVLRVPNDPFVDIGDGDFTIDAWIYPENLSAISQNNPNQSEHRIIMDNRVTNNFHYSTPASWPGITFYVNNEQWNTTSNQWDFMRLGLALKDNASSVNVPASEFLSGSAPIVRNQWQHVAVVISRNGVGTFYYNGTPIGTFTPVPGTFVDVNYSPSLLDIGHSSRLNCGTSIYVNDYFNGLLDEIEIFKRALNPSEIMAIYAAGCAGKCKTRRPFHAIDLMKGWNIFSSNISPVDPDMKTSFQSLIDNGSLVKVQDESGNSLEDYGVFGGWKNNIGNIALTEGYKVKVKQNCQLNLEGNPATLPLDIPLKQGWNMMGYPLTAESDPLLFLQKLIDRRTLVKVQDETGNSIEDWGFFGGWQNNIGNFKPGEGYKVKVNTKDTLTIYESYRKSLALPALTTKTTHFHSVGKGNGVDHMNINFAGLSVNLIEPGDEIGVFDGTLCVGSAAIPKNQSSIISIPVTAADGKNGNGFTEGNIFTLKIWKAGTGLEFPVEPDIIKGTPTFVKHETTLVSLEKYAATGYGDILLPAMSDIKIYPNPTNGKVYIDCGRLSAQGMQIQVTNSTGQIVLNRIIETNPGMIDLSGNVSGIYYIKVIRDSGIKTEKIILR